MKRSFMRSLNAAKLCLAAGPYSQRSLNPTHQTATDRSHRFPNPLCYIREALIKSELP